VNGTLLLVELAGHVGLLLWGTHMVGTGVQRGFGMLLRRWLGRNLDSRPRAFMTGLGITALLQSSTATGLLATSFTATGVMALAPALSVMLGANVGSALLPQLLSFNIALVGPPAVLVGVLAFRWAHHGRTKNLGRIAIGLGLMLMALAALLHTLAPVENAPLLRPLMSAVSDDPVMAMFLAALLTWACHSSIAIVLLVASFEVSHVVGPSGALALVLGANLGGALPALLNAATPAARRLPLGNFMVRGIGVLVALPFLHPIAAALAHSPHTAGRLVVDFHLLFNVALAAVFLGPIDRMARWLTAWLPDPPAPIDRARPVHLDAAALDSPSVALANASRETLRMADMIDAMLRGTLDVICRDDRPRAETVLAEARCVDQLGAAIRRYLADIGDGQTLDNHREGAQGQNILAAVINLEHVADILANGLIECSLRSLKRGKRLAPEETEVVSSMHAALVESLRLALAVFLQANPADARCLVSGKAKFREFEAASIALSARLLRTEAAASRLTESDAAERITEESGLFLRTVRDLRRIHSHLASFAYPILHHDSASQSKASAKAAARAATLTTTIK